MMFFDISKKRAVVFIVIMGVSSFILTFTLDMLEIDIWQNIWHFYFYIGALAMVHQSFQYKSIIKGLVAGAFSTLLVFGMDGMSTMFVVQFSSYEFNWGTVYIMHTLVVCAVVFLLRHILKKRIDMNIFNNKGTYLVTVVSGIMIIVTYIVYRADEIYAARGIMYGLVFATMAVMFAVIMNNVFKDTTRRTEMLLTEASKQYIRGLEESYHSLRTIKHDYVNIMTSFKIYIDDRDIDGLAKYYYNELSALNCDISKEDRLIGSLQNVKINEIKSIIIYKCSFAAQNQVATITEVNEPIDSLGISTAIVCQVLGILLDNAIEAALETEEKSLSIAIIANSHSKTFVIKNSWRDNGLDLSKIFELGFSTKGEGRGVGLYTVRGYTNKIKGLLIQTMPDPEGFTQILTVKDSH